MDSILASRPSCLGFDSQHSPKNFNGKKISDINEVNQKRRLEGSVQWLENCYRTHLVLANGKQAKSHVVV